MTTVDERSTGGQRVVVYLVVGVVLGGLLVAGYLLFHSARVSAEAEAKADLLVSRLAQAGARTPSRDQVVRLLGTDGGSTCADPGATPTPGARRVLSPEAAARAQRLVIEIYCPEKLATGG
ncbi:Uncharacterised protein [Amycolatopsis camponoti]|uniref:DUF732 domain-containing protein n=1 Tax=Amycolatopsis camponoti TaxID=2606593 RepID=A0A6I8LY48_9PSEU|nr:hypothetical protein [Amycolatopsis camponoti]VVJ22111.1 Uncharacterised protein [Amycolatopsis camponoti]